MEQKNRFKNLIISVLVDNFVARKFILKRNKNYLIPFDLNEIKKFSYEIQNITKSDEAIKRKKYIEWFYNILSKKCTDEELKIFNRNIKTFKTIQYKKSPKSLFDAKEYLGIYDIKKNIMFIYGKYEHATIFHEMLHMSSTKLFSSNELSGFSQTSNNIAIGNGLNEGYTELLTQRFLNLEFEEAYEFEKSVALALEKIVGYEQMKKYYFTCDLYGLSKNLLTIYRKEDIEKFITAIDFVSALKYIKILDPDTLKLLLSNINYIVCFLYYGYCKKLKSENYLEEEIINLINEYSEILNFYYEDVNENLICYNTSKVNKIISKYFNDIKINNEENIKVIF